MTLNIVQEIQKQNENHVQNEEGKEEELATYDYPSTERRRSRRLLSLTGDKAKLIKQNGYSGLTHGTNGGEIAGRNVNLNTIVKVKLKESAPTRDRDKLQKEENRDAQEGSKGCTSERGSYIMAANSVKKNTLVKKVSLNGNQGKTSKVNKKKIEKGVVVVVDKKKSAPLNKGNANPKGTSVQGMANKTHSTVIVKKKKKHQAALNRAPLLSNKKEEAQESKYNSFMACKMRIDNNIQEKEKEKMKTGQIENGQVPKRKEQKEPPPVKDNLPGDKIKSRVNSDSKEELFLQKRLKMRKESLPNGKKSHSERSHSNESQKKKKKK
ncbi:hypothetical protein AK88_00521 [Plasmodium fragile]|uniref:Uncharacterized protein n=1 Tax=Plasmodium fragile TaxID=5857 RepID=A0A0D9QSB1_PLAFR|nr:uncharacterized protein AK88_00521 [Plasmodium fragile]KJP89813.1 hypothetical protein AK88_00521 [Plasmodium fragile]